jgi:DNA-binding Lrp family transcriptional regulator
MKDVERRLISELMKDARRSDRELAKSLGVSQPTVTRTRTKLEKEGYIREYAAIPDFKRLGYELMALIFVQIKQKLAPEELEKARETTQQELAKRAPTEIIFFERGMGMGFSGVIISFHKDYQSYTSLVGKTREYPFLEHVATESFLIDLNDEVHYRPLTLRTLAENILMLKLERASDTAKVAGMSQ